MGYLGENLNKGRTQNVVSRPWVGVGLRENVIKSRMQEIRGENKRRWVA